jgi:hypothetical protein
MHGGLPLRLGATFIWVWVLLLQVQKNPDLMDWTPNPLIRMRKKKYDALPVLSIAVFNSASV